MQLVFQVIAKIMYVASHFGIKNKSNLDDEFVKITKAERLLQTPGNNHFTYSGQNMC